jgi:hypothetical protein
VKEPKSYTGQFLKDVLRRARKSERASEAAE